MKKLIIFVFVLALTAATVFAQDTKEDEAVKDVAIDFENNVSALISQDVMDYFSQWSLTNIKRLAVEANSIAAINTIGSYNETTITQTGEDNVGIIQIRGSSNVTGLTQNGNDLLSLISVEGSWNKLLITQEGSNLSNYIKLDGTGVKFNILQNFQGVILTQIGGTSIPLMIETTGRTVPIIISNN